jgi:hypothetical protein
MKHHRLAVVSSTLVLAALGGCARDNDILGPVPSNVAITSGSNQRGTPGTALPGPLEVSVTSSEGRPVAGVDVHWIVTTGAGTLSSVNTITDSDGHASASWTLGSNAGAQSVEAIVVTVASPALFTATAASPVVLHSRVPATWRFPSLRFGA